MSIAEWTERDCIWVLKWEHITSNSRVSKPFVKLRKTHWEIDDKPLKKEGKKIQANLNGQL